MGLIMLDLDGTLVEDALVEVDTEKGMKLQRRQHELYTEPRLKPHVYEALQTAAEEGDSFAIVTNQGGVALGYHTQAEVYRRIASTVGQLACFWGRPSSVHVAFMLPTGSLPQFKGDDGRKPAPDMLVDALARHGSNSRAGVRRAGREFNAIMVGDMESDREAAAAAGVEFASPGDFFAW